MKTINTILVLTLFSLSGYGFLPDDYNRHYVQVLVTSAEATQVNHGVIEAYYPDAVFYHHKLHTVDEDNTYSTEGFLVLDPKNRKETRIPVSFEYLSRHKGDFKYTIPIDALSKIIPGLPNEPYALPNGLKHDHHIEIGTTAPEKRDYFSNHMIFPLFPVPVSQTAGKEAKPAKREDNYPANLPPQKVYSLEIGDKKTVEESYNTLLRGMDREDKDAQEIGKELYERHFNSWPIKFEVAATDPLEEEDEAKKKERQGWYLVHSPRLKVGHLVLPRIRSANSKGGRTPLAIPTNKIYSDQNDSRKLSSFSMEAASFIGLALSDTIPGATQYKCKINDRNTSLTACRLEEKKQILYIYPSGSQNQRLIYLENAMEPDADYRVSLSLEDNPSSPQGRSVTPVRFAEGLSEDSPNGNKLD